MKEMQRILCSLMLIVLVMGAESSFGQKILLLQNTHNLKNFKYYEGDYIKLKIGMEKRMVEGDITCLTDSSVCIGSWEEVLYKDISVIYKNSMMINILRGVLLTGGVAYFAIDSFNRLINNDAPVILMETLAISGGLVGLNFLLIPLSNRRFHMDKWQLEMLDFTQFGMSPFRVP